MRLLWVLLSSCLRLKPCSERYPRPVFSCFFTFYLNREFRYFSNTLTLRILYDSYWIFNEWVSLKRATLKEPQAFYEILESFLYKAEQTNVILVINSTKTMIRSTAMLTCSLVSFEIFIPHTIKLIIEPIFYRIAKTSQIEITRFDKTCCGH